MPVSGIPLILHIVCLVMLPGAVAGSSEGEVCSDVSPCGRQASGHSMLQLDRTLRPPSQQQSYNPVFLRSTPGPRNLVVVRNSSSSILSRPYGLTRGLMVVRIPKTGSSTMLSVAMRLGLNYNMDTYEAAEVDQITDAGNAVLAGHMSLGGFKNLSSMGGAFKFSFMRDPAERCMSAYYHLLEGKTGTAGLREDRDKVAWLRGACNYFNETEREYRTCLMNRCTDFESNYLEPERGSTAREIFQAYDFLGLTERYDESLVLLSWRMGLPMSDVLYVKLKVTGEECRWDEELPASEHVDLEAESRKVQEVAAELRNGTSDMELFKMVNASIDWLIEEYGKSDFEADMTTFRDWLAIADSQCGCDVTLHYVPDCLNQLVADRGWASMARQASTSPAPV